MQASFSPDEHGLSGLEFKDLEEIVLWDPANWVDLIIRSSKQTRLRIQGDTAMIQRYQISHSGNTLSIKLGGNILNRIADALTTSLTRKRIQVELMVDSLDRVRATGMVQVDMTGWKGDEPEIRLFGPTALWGATFPVMEP